MSEYNLEVAYVPGKENDFADGLSRRPDLRLMAVGALSPYDPWLKRINDAVSVNTEAQKFRKQALQRSESGPKCDGFVLQHGVLYYSANGLLRVFVPKQDGLRVSLIREFHDLPISGHFGWRKTYHALAQHYYWGNMTSDVHSYVTKCPVCQRMKPTRQPKPPIQPLEVPSRPFDRITLDWMTIGCTTKEGYDSVLCVVDKFTKWAIVIACDKHMSTSGLIDLLYKNVFSWVGLPNSIVGDRDTRLTAGEMRALCRGLCLKLKLSVAYHPQTDGQTEQFNSTLLQMLRCFVGKYHTDWPQHIPALLYAYHNTVHTATGYTPHKLLFGWSPRDLRAPLSCPDAKSCGDRDIEQWLRDRKSELKQAQVSMEVARQAMIRARKAALYPTEYKVGDKVKVSTDALPVRCPSTVSEKLQPKYIGPFTVLDVQGKVLHLQMPKSYAQVHDRFNIEQVRP
jgi:hypothetical protein